MEAVTKTTLLLADSRRARLKALAIERGTTVTELLSEGADLVLEKYQGLTDRETLLRRARAAREHLRQGLYEGPAVAASADEVLYPVRVPGQRRRR
ncbi:MAG TPA: ribbon-helix-helix domain-containing protein [Polyangiaceae bacterium]|nr:ribbon-helix-helix domain-containing protein [Polyangiaceae bacterium]